MEKYGLLWSRCSVLSFTTQVRRLKPGRSIRKFRAKTFLSTPSFGGEVKPPISCRRFAACKRSRSLCGNRNWGKITGQLTLPHFHLPLLGSLASLRMYRHFAAKVGTSKGGESNGKLPPRTCTECSVPEPYRSHELAFVPASPASKPEN